MSIDLEGIHHLHPGRLTPDARNKLIIWASMGALMVLGLALLIIWMFLNTPPPQGTSMV
jgi:hypothetical protein